MADGVAGPVALVLSALGGQARGRLLQLLPASLRESVAAALEGDRSPRGFCEQVLLTDIERVQAESQRDDDAFAEVVSLKVADLIGVILLHATPEQAAGIVTTLPQRLQNEVIHKIAVQDWETLGRRLGAHESGLVAALDGAWGAGARRTDPQFAADTMRHITSQAAVRRILSGVHRMDSGAATAIQRRLFSLEDMDRLSDREIQTFLRGVDDWDLAIALGTLPRRLRGRILSNTSERRARLLSEDEAHLADRAEEEVETVRERMLRRVWRLYEAGQITTYLGSVGVQEDKDEEGDDPEVEVVQERAGRKGAAPKADAARRFGKREALVTALVVLATVPVGIWVVGQRSGPDRARSRGAALKAGEYSRSVGGRSGSEGSEEAPVAGAGRVSADQSALPNEGDVLVFSGDAEAPDLESLSPGDRLHTPVDARAVVKLWGGAGQVQVEPGTDMQLGDTGETTQEPPKLRLRVGSVWLHVKNPLLEVHSPVALTTASAGALMKVRVVLSAATEVSVSEGTAWVVPKNVADARPVVLAPGDWVRVETDGGMDVRRDGEPDRSGWLGLF